MITKHITIDDCGNNIEEFINKMINKYHIKNTPHCHINYRGITKSSLEINQVITNDRLIEIIINNKLVALIYVRRNDLNFTETNLIDFEQ